MAKEHGKASEDLQILGQMTDQTFKDTMQRLARLEDLCGRFERAAVMLEGAARSLQTAPAQIVAAMRQAQTPNVPAAPSHRAGGGPDQGAQGADQGGAELQRPSSGSTTATSPSAPPLRAPDYGKGKGGRE